MQRPPPQPPDYEAIKRLLVKVLKKLAYVAALGAVWFYLTYYVFIPNGYFDSTSEGARVEISALINGVHLPGTERPLAEIFRFNQGRSGRIWGGDFFATIPESNEKLLESVYSKEDILLHFRKELGLAGWSEKDRKHQDPFDKYYRFIKGDYELLLRVDDSKTEGMNSFYRVSIWPR